MPSSFDLWRADPLSFIETALIDPESGEPFVLSDAERWFLKFAFQINDSGRLKYPELVFGAIKKSGKTTLAAIIVITMVLLYGGRFAEAFCLANSFEQSQSRVFTMARRIVEASPLLKAEARITADKIAFTALDATIIAIASDAASAAGANPTIVCFDELWGYVSENSRRLWDEMPTPRPQDQRAVGSLVCGLHRRELAARRALQARHGTARSRSFIARRLRHAVCLAHRANRAVADCRVGRRDAPHHAPHRLRPPDA
jgi:hypothetical protein